MSRELEFRVWDGEKMRDPDEFYIDGDGTLYTMQLDYVYEGEERGEVAVDALGQTHRGEIVMQYTGLKDDDDQDIYEGDILCMNGGADDFYASVGFEHGCFVLDRFPWQETAEGYPELHAYTKPDFISVHVAGNIYENPDLITTR